MANRIEWERWVVDCGARYFAGNQGALAPLPLPHTTAPITFEIVEVPLPDWMAEFGPQAPRSIPVDRCCLIEGAGPPASRCDWLRAAFIMLSGAYERAAEAQRGPIHSYCFRLPRAWDVFFRRPWVNWIFLMLARQSAGRPIEKPKPTFYLTHDVDAVSKTMPTRFKQGVFNAVNSGRLLARGQVNAGSKKLLSAFRMATLPGNYWQFEKIMEMENSRGLRSTWNIYGGAGGWLRSPRHVLMDPMYSAADPKVSALLRKMIAGGWQVGLHQAFDSWAHSGPMRREAEVISAASGVPITRCRQHWLRFSWERTWKAQEQAGFTLDTTIGFNDRSGFRLGSAISIRPWDAEAGAPQAQLTSIPLVLMDSHLHDYGILEKHEIEREIDSVVDEVATVGGVASVLWHPHTMHADYGWAWSYEFLLDRLAAAGHECL